MGKLLEGVWDCKYCDTKKIRGSIRNCPNCGKPRDEDTEFYLAEPGNYVQDPSKVSKNPDWVCSFCGSLNADSAAYCTSCGASRQDSEKNYLERKQERQEKKEELERLEAQAGSSAPKTGSTGQEVKASPIRKLLPLFLLLIPIILLVVMFMPKKKGIQVESKLWQRSVAIEQNTTFSESDWDLPSGAYNVSRKTELFTYEQVLDHYETKTRTASREVLDGYDTQVTGYKDLGNGYFEEIEEKVPRYRTEYYTETYQEPVYRSEPVYRTKYYYDIDRWVFSREETTSGENSEPYFASPALARNEREGDRSESYQIVSGGKTYNISYDLWQQMETGKNYEVKISGSNIREILK